MHRVTVAKSFLNSSKSLSVTERSSVLDFLTKFHADPSSPGLNLERVQSAIDPRIRSARVTQAVRAIVHKDGEHYTLLYVGRHDTAYDWAERRMLKENAVTGVLQIVESAEDFQKSFQEKATTYQIPGLFDAWEDSYLLSLGLPEEWLPAIRLVRNEDQLLTAAEKLPEEVGERLLLLASGEFVAPPPAFHSNTFESRPDNFRRFWVVKDASELLEILQKPLEEWMRFLHPSQHQLATGTFNGPVKVTGSAGTGKTVVAMHRARHLARQGKAVLLTSFVTTLCSNLQRNLQVLCSDKERSLITVGTVHSQALRLARQGNPGIFPLDDRTIREAITECIRSRQASLDPEFVHSEWNSVIQRMGISTWQEYRYAQRKGRGSSLSKKDRLEVWDVLEHVIESFKESGGMPWSHICRTARRLVENRNFEYSYDGVVVDEIQDLSVEELKFLYCICRQPGDLMLVGDAGQRIYGTRFSLSRLGIDVRGRSHILKINYRTTEQIRRYADQILGDTNDDMDGGSEDRGRTRSLFWGPEPAMKGFDSPEEEYQFVLNQIEKLLKDGFAPEGIAVFARTGKLLNPLRIMMAESCIPMHDLSSTDTCKTKGGVNVGTMHRAKGLEFKVVFVIDCSINHLPLFSVQEKIKDPLELEEFRTLERQLLYVTVTRARDEAYVLWSDHLSPFLEPLLKGHGENS